MKEEKTLLHLKRFYHTYFVYDILKFMKILRKIITTSFYLLFFLIPLAMTPWNYELFEFNKIILVYLFTTIILISWLLRMVLEKKFVFQKTFWDIPLLIFFGSQIIATILSIDLHTSIWGYYSRFNGGLLSTISYLILYWAFVSNINKNEAIKGIKYLLFSALLVSLYGIAEHFGIDARFWVQDVQNRVFSTLGQPNWLAAWLVTLLTISLAFFLNKENPLLFDIKNKKITKIFSLVLLFIFYLCLLYTKSRSGFLGFVTTYTVFWAGIFFLNKEKIKRILKSFGAITGFLLIITIIVGTPWTPQLKSFFVKQTQTEPVKQENQIQTGGTESGEIRKIVWKGALNLWKNHPVFGTGVETFAYSYYWYRLREHNDVSEWDFLYNKAHNEYLNFGATSGTIGLLSYLALTVTFILWSLKQIIKKKKKTILNIALLSGFTSILVTNFFGFSVTAVSFLFFLLPALSFINLYEKDNEKIKNHSKLGNIQYIGILALLAVFAILVSSIIRYWYADNRFALGERFDKAGYTTQSFEKLEKAINIRPNEPTYLDQLSIVSANLAVQAAKQEKATLSSQLIDTAINASSKALAISPYNINFWKNRTRVFYKLSEINEDYNNQAITALIQASKLSPTDAKVQYNIAILYSKFGQQETAIETLEKTIELKPNYDQARYALALFYEGKGEIEKAQEQLRYILEKINPDHEMAIEKLKNLK